jgi:L-threonylcarbamoyladenylate synthase
MKINISNIKKAKKILDNNHCVAIPTETVYGLAANAYSDIAVKKIYKLKKRPKYNPLIIHYYTLKDLKKDCVINKEFLSLYKRFSPGPITYILKLRDQSNISKIATNNKNTLAVRFPKHRITKHLLKILAYPLAAPSANISSKVSAVSSADVKDDFGKKLKYILEGGKSSIGVESTIISLIKKPKILRLGGLETSKINKALNKNLGFNLNPTKILTSGQMRLHYSPGLPIKLNVSKSKSNEAYILLKKPKILKDNLFYLSKNGNLKEAAQNLYSILRKIKKSKFKSIAIEKISDKGLGMTINDRLIRASKY